MNIVLDIDNTLVYGYVNEKTNKTILYRRPFLEEFFQYIFSHFATVSIWTNASERWFSHVNYTVFSRLMPADKKFHCVITKKDHDSKDGEKGVYVNVENMIHFGVHTGTATGNSMLKPLSYLYQLFPDIYHSRNTLILDDNPATYVENIANAIAIKPYYLIEEAPDKMIHIVNGVEMMDCEDEEYNDGHNNTRARLVNKLTDGNCISFFCDRELMDIIMHMEKALF